MITWVLNHKEDLDSLQAVGNEKVTAPEFSMLQIAVERYKAVLESYLIAVGDASLYGVQQIAWPPENPQQYDEILQLRGHKVGIEIAQNLSQHRKLKSRLAWTRSLVLASSETSDVSTRLAATSSIGCFFEAVLAHENLRHGNAEMLHVYLALYDTLVDDDEDVRGEAARVTSLLLSAWHAKDGTNAKRFALSPPAAKIALTLYLVREYRESSELWTGALLRMTGLVSRLGVSARVPGQMSYELPAHRQPSNYRLKLLNDNSVSQLYEEATRPQNVVFEEEKQNLYIDPVQEANVWTDLLCQLNPKLWPEADLALHWDMWTRSGLVFFSEISNSIEDGVLGISSKADVFTLIYRLVSVTKVIINYQARGIWTGSNGELGLIALLRNFLAVGKKAQLHELLLDKMKEICYMQSPSF